MTCNGWIEKYFAECAELIKEPADPYKVQGMPYIGLEHIAEGCLFLIGHGYAQQVTSIKLKFRKGDILFGRLRPYFRKVIIAPFDGICSTDIWVVRAKRGIDQRFLFYWMASLEFINDSTRASEGTKMPRAQWGFLGKIKKAIPPLREQQAIACILGALDDKIELNRRMNETLEGMARALFKSWFVDFEPVRYKAAGQQPPGLAPHIADLFPDGFEQSELGEIPRGWRAIGLNEIGTFLNGLALQKYPPNDDNESLPIIKIAQLRKGETQGADKATADIDPKYIIEDGDVLFSWSGSLECVLWTGGRGVLNQHLFKVTSNYFPKWFYYFWIHKHLPWFQSLAAGKATTMGHIQRHHLVEAKVLLPPKKLLKLMDKIFKPFIDEVITRSLESRKLREIRDNLLPKLISGELRVPDAERIVGRCI